MNEVKHYLNVFITHTEKDHFVVLFLNGNIGVV